MSKKQKKNCRVLNYTEHLLILISAVTGCVSISGFASFVGISIEIKSFVVGLKACLITARIKKHKSIINKKKTMHDKIALSVKI